MKNFILRLSILLVSLPLIHSCKRVYTNLYYKVDRPEIVNDNTVTKGNVSISLKEMDINEYLKPEYSRRITVLWGSKGNLTSTYTTTVNLFHNFTVYEVEIVNNTDHILRLSSARKVLILPDRAEPIFACDKECMLKNIPELPAFEFAQSQIRRRYSSIQPITWKGLEETIASLISSKAFLSSNTEVIPGMRARGFVVFPYNGENIEKGIISFIDVESSTDQAGQTSLKTRFDFNLERVTIYTNRVFDQGLKQYLPHVLISQEEYDAEQQRISQEAEKKKRK